MKDGFAQYCKDALELEFTSSETWQYAYSKLKDIIPRSTLHFWANKELPLEAKKVTRPRNIRKKIPMLESLESERSQLEERNRGKTNQGVDEFEVDKRHEYDVDYLRDVTKSQHDRIVALEQEQKAQAQAQAQKTDSDPVSKSKSTASNKPVGGGTTRIIDFNSFDAIPPKVSRYNKRIKCHLCDKPATQWYVYKKGNNIISTHYVYEHRYEAPLADGKRSKMLKSQVQRMRFWTSY